MTTAPDGSSARLPGRNRFALWTAALLTAIALVGTVLWFVHPFSAPPTPPLVPLYEAEPGVSALIEKSRERVLREPRSAQAWGCLGQAFIANDMEAESQICFAEAERLDPSNPRWPYYQGGSLLNQGDRETALPYLRRAVERCAVSERDNHAPQLTLAETLLTLGRQEEAEEHFRQVLERQADNPRARYGMALVASARQDWESSRSQLLRCVGSPFVQRKARVQLAIVSQRLGDEASADKFRRQADALPPDPEWIDPFVTEYLLWAVKKQSRYRLVESLETTGRLKEAVTVLQPMLSEYPNDYLPWVTLARVLGQLGEYDRAEQVMREALRLAPEKVQSHYYLSLMLLMQAEKATRNGDRDRAEKLYQEAAQRARETLAIKPDYGFAHMALGLSLKGLGQRDNALAALRQAVLCNPEQAELHFHFGELLAEDGRQKESRQQLEEAIQIGSSNAPWRQTALDRLAATVDRPLTSPKRP
ncbi:MAG TPA: tetratricopeptide repeat protein [Gemmataceae bacterium]|nr:tetratricopeptide repeat protein [Gemmataceae bacterium]